MIKSIELENGMKLTLEEARELKRELDEIFPAPAPVWPIYPFSPYPDTVPEPIVTYTTDNTYVVKKGEYNGFN